MDKSFQKERFETLKVKASVALKFRRFCKSMSKSQSMTLMLMLEFFENNEIFPMEIMGPRMESLEHRISILIKKRMNGMIAIMKDIKKHQTKPTFAMIQSLFAEIESGKKPRMIEKTPEEFKAQFEKDNSESQYENG